MGTASNPTPITSGQEVSFNSTAVDNYYSFTLDESGNLLFSGSDLPGSSIDSTKLYDSNLNLVDYLSNGSSKSLQAGTYLIFPSDNLGGTFSVTSTAMADNTDPVVDNDIDSFVNRLYANVLGRGSDSAGLEHWIAVLESTTAADVAKSFYNSPEFLNGNYSDFEFIQTTYLTFMGRQYDESGMTHWLNQLNLGLSRDGLLDSFSSSPEFSVLAEAYGIKAYGSPTSPALSSDPIEDFVTRFYTDVLGRSPDNDGLNNWVNQLKSNNSSADDIATGFFFSQEFIDQNTSNNEFVTIAYKTLLGRDADVNGLDNWVSHLANGMSRPDMLDGFIYSQEFSSLANEYGINIGEPELPDEPPSENGYPQLTTGSYSASTYDHYYDLQLSENSNVFLSVTHDNGSAIYDDALNFVADITTGPMYLEAGDYIVHADFASTTNGVLNTYIPEFTNTSELVELTTGSYSASTYDHYYDLQLSENSNVFLSVTHDNGSAIYDDALNFVADITTGPMYLEAGDYIVHADFASTTNGELTFFF